MIIQVWAVGKHNLYLHTHTHTQTLQRLHIYLQRESRTAKATQAIQKAFLSRFCYVTQSNLKIMTLFLQQHLGTRFQVYTTTLSLQCHILLSIPKYKNVWASRQIKERKRKKQNCVTGQEEANLSTSSQWEPICQKSNVNFFIFSFLTLEFERFKKAICSLRQSYAAQAWLQLVIESPAQGWSVQSTGVCHHSQVRYKNL